MGDNSNTLRRIKHMSMYSNIYLQIILVMTFLLLILYYTRIITPSNFFPVMRSNTCNVNLHLNLTPLEKLTFLSPYGGSWLNGKNNCSCNIGKQWPLTAFYDPKNMVSIEKRRRVQYEQHKKRNELPLKNIITAQPNSPLSYPIHGVEVMPLQSIVIPGLGVFAWERRNYMVKLKATQGVFNTIADVPEGVLNGLGDKELTVTSPCLQFINVVLKHITYTSKKYHINTVDVDSNINSLVTITTKTFLRYHKLRVLIDSIRRFYPNMTIIIADDSEIPEKIEGPHIEQYMMPFAKV
ncbi:beta-1,4 N-acetylgalactosaminyltransferase 2-like isoform X4 [Mustelus asterias]